MLFSLLRHGHRVLRPLLLLGSLLPASYVVADFRPESQFSGFATMGLVVNNHPELGFRRDITQSEGPSDGTLEWKTDSLIGVQWQGRWSPKFDATLQLVAKERHKNELQKAVEWAFVRYRPMDGLDLRVGRLGADVFLLSEFRQVGYTYPWVRPPQDYYGALALYHFDGFDLTKRFDLARGTLNVKVFYGETEQDYPGSDTTDDGVTLNFTPRGISFNLEMDNWRWRYTYVDVKYNNNMVAPLTDALEATVPLWPEAVSIAEGLNTKGKGLTYHALGGVYDDDTWWLQGEAARLSSNATLNPSGRYYYLSVGRRFDDILVYATQGFARPDRGVPSYSPPQGYPPELAMQLDMVAAGVNRSVQGISQKQSSIGVGARWDFRPRMALKFQVDRFSIDKSGTNLWSRDGHMIFTENQSATVASFAMDVLF